MQTVSKNSIFTIFPYKQGSVWMFDDEKRGIMQEPFVAGADTLLDKLSEGNDKLALIFSAIPFPGHQLKVEFVSGSAASGTYYHSPDHQHDLWLCPVLGHYFEESPNQIFVQIKL